MFSRVAIVGTGLIGGSFALALRRARPGARIVGWDRADVLATATAMGAMDEQASSLADAVHGAQLVYIALPVGATIESLPAVAEVAAPGALVTDAASTKLAVCRTAANCNWRDARFLGGHPIAGKERSGIANADPDLFRGAKYALAAKSEDKDERVAAFAALIREMGAEPVFVDTEAHDRAMAFVSHLPQLVAVALAGVATDSSNETGLPLTLAGSGLRDTLRLAGSPYDIWRDICLTNREEIAAALDRLAQALDHLRNNLASRELRDQFERANDLYKILREMK